MFNVVRKFVVVVSVVVKNQHGLKVVVAVVVVVCNCGVAHRTIDLVWY